MKTRKHHVHWVNICNGFLSGALALLGFTACGEEQAEEYGMPYATYELKGKVVDKETKEAIKDARVIVRPMATTDPHYIDTLRMEADGTYRAQYEGVSFNSFRLVCDDPEGTYKADSTDIEMEPQGGEGWFMGSDSREVNFELEKKPQE